MRTDEWLALFRLTHDDLAANRRGELSQAQQQLARGATREDLSFMIGLSVAAWAMLAGLAWMLQTSPHAIRPGEPITGVHVAMIGAGAALPLASTAWTLYCAWIHLRSRGAARVLCAEGVVDKKSIRYRQAAVWTLELGGETLDVSEQVFARVREGARYRVYYVPTSRVVVMVEPV